MTRQFTISEIKESQHCKKLSVKTIPFKENSIVFYIGNNSKRNVHKCRIDNGLIKEQTIKKCDFLAIIEEKEQEKIIFIELKGKHYEIAFEQILSTDKMINTKRKGKTIKKEAFIITRRAPAATGRYQSNLIKKENDFKKQKITLHHPKSSPYTANV